MVFFVLTKFVLVKYSRAFVERPSQGTSSLASRLTTVSLDYWYEATYVFHYSCTEWMKLRTYKYSLIHVLFSIGLAKSTR